MWMFAASLWRHVTHCAFQNFQQGLLHTLTRHVAGNGYILGLAPDFVYFIHVNDAAFGLFHIVVGCLKEAQNNVFNVFADISRFGQCRGVGQSEGDFQQACQRAGQ